MYKYTCLNNISGAGLEKFGEGFESTNKVEEADAILVRSANMKDMDFSENLMAIARAGAGVNNIPIDKCAEEGIVVFNTPGANANAVKELVIAGMLLSARDIVGGISWVNENQEDPEIAKAVEKKKKDFSGSEIYGKSLGIIGLGAIGVRVANAALGLGMTVYGYDPYISVDTAWKMSGDVIKCTSLDQIFETCDYITIHVPLMDSTKYMLNAESFEKMKDNATILNFSRDILVDEDALLKCLDSGKIKYYVTDFPNPKVTTHHKALVIPHLGASTEESEENCAVMAVHELRNYLLNGNINNSVNYPNCDMGEIKSACRITICHKNKKSVIAKFATIFGDDGINIVEMANKSKGEYAYSIVDVEGDLNDSIIEKLKELPEVLKVRVLNA